MNILFIQLGMYDFGVKYKFLFMRDAKVGERAAAVVKAFKIVSR